MFLKSLCQPPPFRYHCSEVLRALDLAVKAESLRQAGPCSTELPDIESRNQRVMLTFWISKILEGVVKSLKDLDGVHQIDTVIIMNIHIYEYVPFLS